MSSGMIIGILDKIIIEWISLYKLFERLGNIFGGIPINIRREILGRNPENNSFKSLLRNPRKISKSQELPKDLLENIPSRGMLRRIPGSLRRSPWKNFR